MTSLSRNVFANYVGRTWTALLSILLIPVYLRFMGIEAYGLVGFYATLSSVMGLLDLGIGATLNRELARLSACDGSQGSQRDLVRTLETIYWAAAILAGLTVFLLGPYLANSWVRAQSLDPSSILSAVRLMGIAIVLQFPVSFYQGGLMGLQRQVLVNGILVLSGTLRSVGAVLVLWLLSSSVEIFFGWQVVSSLIGVGIFFIAMWRSLPKHSANARFNGHLFSGLWRYAAAISANAIIGIVLSQLDKVVLSRMLTLKLFGYYSVAATVASSVWMIIVPFNAAVFPRFVQLIEMGRGPELSRLFHRSAQVLAALLLPASALLIVFAPEILFLWMRDPAVVENCHLIVSLLVLGIMLNGITSIPNSTSYAFGWPQLVTYTNALQAIVMVPLIIGMVYWRQGVGAAIAWVILNSTYVIFMMPALFRRYLKEEKRRWFLFDVGAPVLISFTLCALSKLVVPSTQVPLTIASWLVVTGIVTVIATAAILPHVRGLVISRLRAFSTS